MIYILRYTLIGLYLELGRVDDALAAYHRYARLRPDDDATRAQLLEVLTKLGRADAVRALTAEAGF